MDLSSPTTQKIRSPCEMTFSIMCSNRIPRSTNGGNSGKEKDTIYWNLNQILLVVVARNGSVSLQITRLRTKVTSWTGQSVLITTDGHLIQPESGCKSLLAPR